MRAPVGTRIEACRSVTPARQPSAVRAGGRQAFRRSVSPPILALLTVVASTVAAEPAVRTMTNLAYRAADEPDAYARDRCRLDLYLPSGATGFPCLVWFHGGGLETGSRKDAERWAVSLAADGIAVAAVDYRLSPKAAYPAYVRDAAAAAAWVQAHVATCGGDTRRVFVGGHSAGGYLAAMIALDRRWLAAAGMDPEALAGAIPVSGQMSTHSTVCKEREIPRGAEVVDAAAPLTHARADAPPMLFLVGDRDLAGRADQNRRMQEALVKAGCAASRLLEMSDRDHDSIQSRMTDAEDPGRKAVVELIRKAPATKDASSGAGVRP